MVDFTKPVNNADMVKCLNALIHCNRDLATYYEKDLALRMEDSGHVDYLNSLKGLHEQHANLIADTVRFLGGAPDFNEPRGVGWGKSWFDKFRYGAVLDAVEKSEIKLQAQYLESLQEQAVKASPECVAVINQALEECRPALDGLRRIMEEEKQ